MLTLRKATPADMLLYFEWANDDTVRQNSINQEKIVLDDHARWFEKKILNTDDTIMLVFLADGIAIGQLRIEIEHDKEEAIINYSIDKNFRGKGFGTKILAETYAYFSSLNIKYPLSGFVKQNNTASIAAFTKAGFFKNENLFTINNEEYIKFMKGG